ncbi:MAG TPA: ABC transporter permease subunit [Chloroflexota bacterium]|nr:ABC transporter permease subunit [Chloroflexota bacterium]
MAAEANATVTLDTGVPRAIADLHAGVADLQRAAGGGPLGGLVNVWRREWSTWFGTRRWLTHLLIWLVLLVVVPVGILYAATAGQRGGAGGVGDIGLTFSFDGPGAALAIYYMVGTVCVALGGIIATMSTVVDETVHGTALFLLSKPVTRGAFVLGKFGANLVALLLLAIVVPMVLLYLFSALVGGAPALPSWLGAHLLLALHLAVLVALTILLGVLFRSVAPVAGVAVAALFASVLLENPPLTALKPWFIWDLPSIASRVSDGAVPTGTEWTTIVVSAVWLVVFLVAAMIAFAKRDL